MAISAPTKSVGKRVIFYIDGFNLYYGALKDVPPLKWLNLQKFCTLLRPHDEIVKIRYFSALVAGQTKPHQEIQLKALSTTPIVSVILGKFKGEESAVWRFVLFSLG